MSSQQIEFCIIPKQISNELCTEFRLKQDTIFSQYRDIPPMQIATTCPPKVFGTVVGDGNCLYRAVSLSLSGTQDNHRKLREMTATELHLNRRNYFHIDEDEVQGLIDSALLDGAVGEKAWGEQSHLIALSVALRVQIYLFNSLWTPPLWETISSRLKSNCVSVQVHQYIHKLFVHYYILPILFT